MWENLWTLDLHFLHEEIPSISHPFQYSFPCTWWKVKNAIGFPMAFGTGKGCWYFTSAPFILPVLKFLTSHRVPCLWKHWFYWTISCFLIRRRGKRASFFISARDSWRNFECSLTANNIADSYQMASYVSFCTFSAFLFREIILHAVLAVGQVILSVIHTGRSPLIPPKKRF